MSATLTFSKNLNRDFYTCYRPIILTCSIAGSDIDQYDTNITDTFSGLSAN